MSQVDSFDYKPELAGYHGKPLPTSEKPDVFFRPGRSAAQERLGISAARPERAVGLRPVSALAEVADELTVIHSMVAETSNHTPATFQENTRLPPQRLSRAGVLAVLRPGQRDATNLPAFVVIPDARELPGRRHDQLDQRLSARPASGRGRSRRKGPPIDDLFAGRPDRPDDRAGDPRAARRDEPTGTCDGIGGDDCSARGSAATSWPPGCNWPCPK